MFSKLKRAVHFLGDKVFLTFVFVKLEYASVTFCYEQIDGRFFAVYISFCNLGTICVTSLWCENYDAENGTIVPHEQLCPVMSLRDEA